ncbi:MAG: hypothetical protein ACIAQU_00590 [Phycisphaerales bacterium JB064]
MPEDSASTPIEPELLDTAPVGAMCLGCRYDISGMDIRAKCPECGDRIAPSVNFISLEHVHPSVLRGLEVGTRQARQAGLIALCGLLLLCAGYMLGTKGLPGNVTLFGTLVGSGLLLVASGLAFFACRSIARARISGEEQKLRTLRKALPICAMGAIAIAVLSAILFLLTAAGQIYPHRRNFFSYFFILWMVYPFVPIYLVFYLQMLADRSRVLRARVLLVLAIAGFFSMMLMPTALSSGHAELFGLFGIHVTNPYPTSSFLPFDPAYVWPVSLGTNIALALIAIAYVRKHMGFAVTLEDPSPEPPRS